MTKSQASSTKQIPNWNYRRLEMACLLFGAFLHLYSAFVWSLVLGPWCLVYEGSLRTSEIRSAARLGVPGLQASRADAWRGYVLPLRMPNAASGWPASGDEAD